LVFCFWVAQLDAHPLKTRRVHIPEGHGFSFEPALSERREPKGAEKTSGKWRFSA
jgi:hypothetical protein